MTHRPAVAVPIARVLTCLLAALPGLARAQAAIAEPPSQAPLVSRTGGGVAPNVMLTLDVSGSMLLQHMPEGMVVVKPYTLRMPLGSELVRFHPDDTGRQATAFAPATGVVTGVGGSSSLLQRIARSPDLNAIYYNPEVRYQPWIQPDGQRMAQASFRAARLEPMGPSGVLDLSATSHNLRALWCDGTYISKSCGLDNRPFNPALVYRLRKAGSNYLDPRLAGSYEEIDLNSTASFTRHPARTDCAGSTCTQAEEQQNFANWFVYHRSRLLMAKAGLAEALMQMGNVMRLGYGRLNKGPETIDGIAGLRIVESGVRDFTADRRRAVIDWLYGLSAGGGTPLRLALQEVGRYYASGLSTGPWGETPGIASSAPQQACRRAYHVVVTDGYWNDTVGQGGLVGVGNVDASPGPLLRDGNGKEWQYLPSRPYQDSLRDTLADYAMALWSRDLRPDLDNQVPPTAANPAFWQALTHFMVGLGVRGQLDPRTDLPALMSGSKGWSGDQIDDLWHAALNSRGDYFSASDARQLSDALYAAMRTAIERELVEAGVATASATLEAGNRKYIPRYKTGSWSGDVEAFGLNEHGLVTTRVWSARESLPPWQQRNIVTWDPGQPVPQGVAFQWSALSATTRAALPLSWREPAFLDFIRGDRSREDASNGYRVREQVLGDFINGTPVFVRDALDEGHASLPGIGASYLEYVRGVKSARPGVLYVGANDGMLHGFVDTRGAQAALDGREVFAYVPRAVVPRLPLLAQRTYGTQSLYHQYYVDGPLVEADVHVPAPGALLPSWRNYLFGTLGAGGRAVFALDVTDPGALGPASVRWEVSSATEGELGHVTTPIAYGQLANGKWVAVFGNGHGGSSGRAVLFVVDVESGAVGRLLVGNAGQLPNGLGGVSVRRNPQGRIAALYAGDLAGNLWRFDASDGGSVPFVVANAGQPLFRADAGQPIVQPPLLFPHPDSGTIVVIATGRLLTDGDVADTTAQSVYAVRDTGSASAGGPVLKPADLEPRALTSAGRGAGNQAYFDLAGRALDWAARPGWSVSLALEGYAGLRAAYPLQDLGQRVLLVSAVAPGGPAGGCDTVNGKGVNLLIPVDTGLRPGSPLFDSDGDGRFTDTDLLASGYGTAADGADRAVRARGGQGGSPGGGGGACGGLVSLQNATGQALVCLPPPTPPATSKPPEGTTPKVGPPPSIQRRIWSRILKPPF